MASVNMCAMYCAVFHVVFPIPEHVDAEWLRAVINDSATVWNPAPRVIIDGVHLWRHGYNMSGDSFRRLDVSGSPNNEFPWLRTGGTDFVKGGSALRFFWLPVGSRVVVSRTRRGFAHRWPVGAVVGEFLQYGGEVYETRARRKESDNRGASGRLDFLNWTGYQFGPVFEPPGYEGVDNCVDCHRDIGLVPRDIDRRRGVRRDWYGVVGTGEPGGAYVDSFF